MTGPDNPQDGTPDITPGIAAELEHAHLSRGAAEKLQLTDALRIEHIKKFRWIGYTKAHEGLEALEEVFDYPQQDRMPNLLVVGDTNNGKTALIKHFRRRHADQDRPETEAACIPIVYVQAPPGPDEAALYNAILKRLFEATPRGASTNDRRAHVLRVLLKVGVRMLIIDELHHLLRGSFARQGAFLNALKYLGNELCIPIVGVGTADAVRAVSTDPQLANRFTPFVLPNWTMGEELQRLLMSLERLIPLREPSELAAPDLAEMILGLAEGTIGEMSTLLNKAAALAIKKKQERITADMLLGCGYISPSQRPKIAALI